jgi:signal transduction histidine kinase
VRLAVCFIFVTTLPLVVTAIYITGRHLAVVRQVAAEAAFSRAQEGARRLEEALAAARTDVLAVAEWPILEMYRSSESPQDRQLWREKLAVQLRTFVELKPLVRSLTYTDEAGRDVLRVQREGSSVRVEPAVGLADSEPRRLAQYIQLPPRQTLMEAFPSDEDVVLACGTRASLLPGRGRGAVWLEIPCSSLMPAAPEAGVRNCPFLYDETGARLWPASSLEATVLPAGAASGQIIEAGDKLVSWVSLAPAGGDSPLRWRLALAEDARVFEAGVEEFRRAFLAVIGAALLVAALLGVWLARQFTRPVRQVFAASQRIGRGDFDVSLMDTTGDEIGALAEQIRSMAGQLRAAHENFEQQLHDKTQQLVHAERLSTIGRTAAAVAHEINNPSGIISLYAQMLTERLPADDPNAEKLRVIEAKAREISRIVNELLDYSRKPAPLKEWTDARALLQAALDDARTVAQPGDGTVRVATEITVAPDATRLYADPHQMKRVLRNLIVNALQAMSAGGRLTVACRRRDADRLEIEVGDTGAGMDEQQLQHLFDPFYTTKRFGAGTGLGLAISKELTHLHGGSIDVHSQPGRGTRVIVSLPDVPGACEP